MVRPKYLLFVAAVALVVAFAGAPFVHAADAAIDPAATTVEAAPLPAPTLTLKALFATPASEEVIDVMDGVAVGMGATEVLVARLNTDGSVVTACVDSEEAARKFLQAPLEKLATKKAKDQ